MPFQEPLQRWSSRSEDSRDQKRFLLQGWQNERKGSMSAISMCTYFPPTPRRGKENKRGKEGLQLSPRENRSEWVQSQNPTGLDRSPYTGIMWGGTDVNGKASQAISPLRSSSYSWPLHHMLLEAGHAHNHPTSVLFVTKSSKLAYWISRCYLTWSPSPACNCLQNTQPRC